MWIGIVLLLLSVGIGDLQAQGTCSVSIAGLNQNRTVYGPVNAECGWEGACWHSPPWGNWGVTSNYGHKEDGAQFQGWHPGDRQWNSCTSEYPPPDYNYYNWNGYTQQRSFEGINVHGTTSVDVYVNCPRDTNADGVCDVGGCKDVYSVGQSTNWMTLYELDPAFPPWCGGDDLVETLYFPATYVSLTCEPGWCQSAGTSWLTPTSGSATYAEMSMLVNYGTYYDTEMCEYQRFANPEYQCVW